METRLNLIKMFRMRENKDWKFKIALILSFALIFALYLSTLNPELSDLSGDSARFLLLAKSISQGKGYREIENPSEPPHTEYMPGLPILLALIYRLAPDNLTPMKFLIILFAFSSSLFFYLFLFREKRVARYILTLLFSLIPFLFQLQTQILADIPHLAFLLLGFFWFEKSRELANQKISAYVLAGALFAIAFYFRQLALIAFFSGLIVLFLIKNLRHKKIILGYSIGFLIPAGIWYLRNFLVAGAIEPSYAQKLWFAKASNPFAGTLTITGLLSRIIRRVGFFSFHLERDLLLGSYSQALIIIWIALLVFLLIGLGYELLRSKNISAVFFLPYLIVISSWEGWVPRYLLPFLTLSIFFIYRGISLCFKLFSKNQRINFQLTILIFSLWISLNIVRSLSVISFQHTPLFYPPFATLEEKEPMELLGAKNFAFYPDAFEWKKKGKQYLIAKSGTYYHFFAMAEWVKRKLPEDSVVVCRKPRLFAWLSAGKAIQLPAELDPDKFLSEVKNRGGNYLLIEEISPELMPILLGFWKEKPESFELSHQFSQTYLLKINPR